MKARSLPEHMRVPFRIWDALIVYALAWIGLPSLVILATVQLAPYVPIFNSFVDGLRASSIEANFILVLITALGGLGLVWAYLRKYKVGWREVGWRRFKFWQAALYLLAIFVGFIVLADTAIWIVGLLVPTFDANQPQDNGFTGATGSSASLALIALVILPPIIEETVFRGFIFPAMTGRVGVVWGAIISSLLFGFAHLQFNVGIYTFILGLLLCFMYARLKSIFPGMALHMANNLIAYVAISHK